MLEQEFNLPYPPSVNDHLASIPYFDKSKRKWRARQVATEKWKNYLKSASWSLIEQKRMRFKGEVIVEIDVYPPDRRRRDGDNIVKAVFDSLTLSGTIEDDWFIYKHGVERKKELLNYIKIKVTKEA